jgi:type IV pilus assembly protein PilZ
MPTSAQNKKSSSTTKTAKKTRGENGGIENRSGFRVPVQLLVDYRADGHYLFDFCRDLGTGGVFIQTTSPLNTGADIELTFTIPDSKETLSTKGKVIWVQSTIADRPDLIPGMGVQFATFDVEQRETLERFVARYAAAQSSAEQAKDKSTRSA